MDPEHELAPAGPVATQEKFLSITSGLAQPEGVIGELVRALNGTLGIDAGLFEDLLSPRDYSRGLTGTGFAALLPRDRLRITLGDGLGRPFRGSDFLESWPRTLRLEAVGTGGRLVTFVAIPLLMYEILNRAGRGFRPTSQTERSYLVRLDRFYRDIAEYPWAERPAFALYENGRIRARATLSESHLAFAEV